MASFFSQGGTDSSGRSIQDLSNQSTSGFTSTATPTFGGGLSSFERWFPEVFQPSGGEQGFLNSIQGLAGRPRYTPEMQQGIVALQGLLGPPSPAYATAMNAIQGLMGPNPEAINTIRQLLASAMGGLSPLETGGLETMRGRTDPTSLSDAAMRYFTDIVEPSARAGLQAGGLGGTKGGAYSEMLGREGSRLALPLAQMIQQALGEYGGAQMGLGGLLENRRTGLAGLLENMRSGQVAEQSGLANQLFGMRGTLDDRTARQAGQLFGMGQADTRLGELPILGAGLQAAGMGRQGSLADFLRQQQLAMLQRGTTTTGSTTGATSGSQAGRTFGSTENPLTLGGSVLGPLTGLGAAALLSPTSQSIFNRLFGAGGTAPGGGGNFPGVFGDTNQVDMSALQSLFSDSGSQASDQALQSLLDYTVGAY